MPAAAPHVQESRNMNTTRSTDELKAEIQTTFTRLTALRDETRVKIHLAGMDVRSAWDELQPKLEEAEHVARRAAESASEAALEALRATATSLAKIASAL
jgi:hypothetical protein